MKKLSIAAATLAFLMVPQLGADAARVARSGTLEVTAHFTLSSTVTTPLRCSATVNPNANAPGAATEVAVTIGQKLAFTGASATCTLSLVYNFANVDAVNGVVVTLDVSTDTTAEFTGRGLATNVIQMTRSWSLNVGTPANGSTPVDFGSLVL